MDGIRQSKIVDGREYKYTTLDGKVVCETFGGIVVDYFYDNEGKPYKLVVDNGSAAVTGQEFTFKDACVAGVAGGVNAIPYVGPLLNGLVSGGYAAYKSYSTGGNEMDAAISGVTAAFASIASVSNLARAGKVSLSILDASVIDFVNGIGANGMAAAAYQSVNYDNKRMAKASGKRTSNKSKGKSRKHQKPKSSALSENGGSIDYFIYLLNGGTAY